MPSTLKTQVDNKRLGFELIRSILSSGDKSRAIPLINEGADLNVRTHYWQQTALHLATAFGYTDIMEQLLKKGADPESKDRTGNTPFLTAAKDGQVGSITFLLQHGVNPEVTNNYSYNGLMLAASKGHKEAAVLLLEIGIPINATNILGDTALIEAIKAKQLEMAEFLCIRGADSSIKNNSGQTAASIFRDVAGSISQEVKRPHWSDEFLAYTEALARQEAEMEKVKRLHKILR